MNAGASYVVDTSVIIDLKNYPEDVFEGLRASLEKLIGEGRLVAPREVLEELKPYDDEALKWAKRNATMFVETAESIARAKEVITTHKFIDHTKTTPDADPFIIGLAQLSNSTVVTQEKAAKPRCRQKIPDVAGKCGLRCLNFLDFCREQKWKF
jgi:rRNA-processing protein FCF1